MSPITRPRVLLVDDNPEMIASLAEVLDGVGCEVLKANGIAAAKEASRSGLELALVDLRLPDGSGVDLAAELKAQHPDCEVILLTGFATVVSAAEAVRAGAWAYLVKPCATTELLVTVEQALRQVTVQQEKRQLARRAQVAERLAAVGTLTAGLSHEIRNPLNAAALQLAVLERRIKRLPKGQAEPLLGPLAHVSDEIRRLDHILEDFLQFARPTQIVPRPVDLPELLRQVMDFLSGDAQRREVKLECAPAPKLPKVAGDEGRLRQVFMNLTLNAMDASPRGGWVRASCDRQGDHVVAAIEDDGPGVPPEAADRIFEPFYTTKAGGSGLGLPIVHAIVLQHGGSITVTRAASGGARFEVRLPVALRLEIEQSGTG